MLDCLTISMSLNQFQDGLHDLLLGVLKHVLLPPDKMQSVDIVYVLLAFVHFTFDPVTIEVFEEMINISSGRGVTLPLFDVVSKKSIVNVALRTFGNTCQVCLQILNQMLIELLAANVRYGRSVEEWYP